MIKKILQRIIPLIFLVPTINFADFPDTLIVGTKPAEPFVIPDDEGNWSGISFELWERIAEELEINYKVQGYDLEELIEATGNSEIDIAVSPLTITAEREASFDFTHSYFTTGLTIAVSNDGGGFFSIAKKVFSPEFIRVIIIIILVLFLVGFLVWVFERNKNREEFGGTVAHGLGASFWWAAVTMTTVGYGDKAPKTAGGRIVALIWMFAGLIMISGFTAAVASALTVDKLDVGIHSFEDLYDERVVTLKGSSSENFLLKNGVDFVTAETVDEGINLILDKKVDAFVYDAPILKYYVRSNNLLSEVKVLPLILDPINYAFAMPANSPLREAVNMELLKEIDKIEWQGIVNSYIGK